MQVKHLLKSGLAEKNDLLGAAAGIARQDYNSTWPCCILSLLLSLSLSILTHLFNKWTISFVCLLQLLPFSCAIVQWPSSAFFTFAFHLSWPSAAILPQSSIFFTLSNTSISFHPPPSLLPFTNRIIFDSIADPYDYTRLWTFMSVGKVFLNVVIFWVKVDEHRGDFEELWDAWSWGQLAIGNCPALSGERIYPTFFV